MILRLWNLAKRGWSNAVLPSWCSPSANPLGFLGPAWFITIGEGATSNSGAAPELSLSKSSSRLCNALDRVAWSNAVVGWVMALVIVLSAISDYRGHILVQQRWISWLFCSILNAILKRGHSMVSLRTNFDPLYWRLSCSLGRECLFGAFWWHLSISQNAGFLNSSKANSRQAVAIGPWQTHRPSMHSIWRHWRFRKALHHSTSTKTTLSTCFHGL